MCCQELAFQEKKHLKNRLVNFRIKWLLTLLMVYLGNYTLVTKPLICSSFLVALLPTFKTTRDAFPKSYKAQLATRMFFSCTVTRKSVRKTVYGESFHSVFSLEKKPTFKPKLTCACVKLCSALYFQQLCMGCFTVCSLG